MTSLICTEICPSGSKLGSGLDAPYEGVRFMASAKNGGKILQNFLGGGPRLFFEQGGRSQNNGSPAELARFGSCFFKPFVYVCILIGLRKSLYRDDLGPTDPERRYEAGGHDFAVEDDKT
jgi:hypothetical protein